MGGGQSIGLGRGKVLEVMVGRVAQQCEWTQCCRSLHSEVVKTVNFMS